MDYRSGQKYKTWNKFVQNYLVYFNFVAGMNKGKNVGAMPEIWPTPLPSAYFDIHSLIRPQFKATMDCPKMAASLINHKQINKIYF
jgi:hypothetical protein